VVWVQYIKGKLQRSSRYLSS